MTLEQSPTGRQAPSVDSPLRRVARGLGRRLVTLGAVEPDGVDLSAVKSADVALYFADFPAKLYQLNQWLPVFEAEHTRPTIVVLRQVEAYNELKGRTSLPLVLVPRYEDLMALYDRAGFRAVVYVNNGWTNFQSLSFQQAVHIHVNHGESDKICMVSNQAKAYDRVFVAGEAAVRRHEAALAWFDTSRLVRVGRPQLDLDVPSPLSTHPGPTITYAPTWEGEDEANNYTSVDVFGPQIIEAALAQPGARVIYKPHPRVGSSAVAAVRSAHDRIVGLIRHAAQSDPATGHEVLVSGDILGVIRGTDMMISDVSSVTLDHLYLSPDAPLLLTDRRSNREQLRHDAPVSSAVHVIDAASLDSLTQDITRALEDDPLRAARLEMREFYFDGIAAGESTTRFWSAVDSAIQEHDEALQDLRRVRTTTDSSSVEAREGS